MRRDQRQDRSPKRLREPLGTGRPRLRETRPDRIASSETLLGGIVASSKCNHRISQRGARWKPRLTRAVRTQLARSLQQRYQAASAREKKKILNEFIAVSGYHPKYAVHLLNAAEPGAPVRRSRVRPALYDEAAKQALIVLWESSDRGLREASEAAIQYLPRGE